MILEYMTENSLSLADIFDYASYYAPDFARKSKGDILYMASCLAQLTYEQTKEEDRLAEMEV